jgi:anaerobic ribonucleoside-triphosphate reductase activating protein
MYVDTKVVFAEVPGEVTLAINISNCPCNCKGCHSPYLGTNTGEPLFPEVLDELIDNNKGITCVAIMGGDSNPAEVDALAFYIKTIYDNIKVAWYSGMQVLSDSIKLNNFDYIKLGPYKEKYGPLNSKTTNQRFYRVKEGNLVDITEKFWK